MRPEEYLDWRNRFEQAWRKEPQLLAFLKPEEQWDLHDYFQFHYYQNQAEALGWYFTIRECGAAVERSGIRAFETLQRTLYRIDQMKDQQQLPLFSKKRHKSEEIKIYAIVNPEMDIDEMIGALIDLGHQLVESQRKKDQRSNDAR